MSCSILALALALLIPLALALGFITGYRLGRSLSDPASPPPGILAGPTPPMASAAPDDAALALAEAEETGQDVNRPGSDLPDY